METRLSLTEKDKKRLFAAIGHIIVRFQQVELWVSEILAGLIELDHMDDRYAVMAAMSYRQKVDLMVTLFPRKARNHFNTDIDLSRKALYLAEEFRNRVVHSVWAVSGDTWTREKGSLRGRSGFAKQSVCVDITQLEIAAESLRTITEWYLVSSTKIEEAMSQLKACESST